MRRVCRSRGLTACLLIPLLAYVAPAVAGTAVFTGSEDETRLIAGYKRDTLSTFPDGFRIDNGKNPYRSPQDHPQSDLVASVHPDIPEQIGGADFSVTFTLDPRSGRLSHPDQGWQRFGVQVQFDGGFERGGSMIYFGVDAYPLPREGNRPTALVVTTRDGELAWTYYSNDRIDLTGTEGSLTLTRRGNAFWLTTSSGAILRAADGMRDEGGPFIDLNHQGFVGTGRKLTAITLWTESSDGSRFPADAGRFKRLVIDSAALMSINPGAIQTLRGVVQSEHGPLAGARVTAAQGDRIYEAATLPDGGFALHLPPGPYLAGVTQRGLTSWSAEGLGSMRVDVKLVDRGTRFHVDAAAREGGDGTRAAPFTSLAEGVRSTSAGDVIELAAGRYEDSDGPLTEPVTIRGAGSQTVLGGQAYWDLAVFPFRYDTVHDVGPAVSLANLTLDGSALAPSITGYGIDDPVDFPHFAAERLTAMLELDAALTERNVERVRTILEMNPGLATQRLAGPRVRMPEGDTFLHRFAYSKSNNPSGEADLQILQLLIDAGADVNAYGGWAYYTGHPPLATYGRYLDPAAVELLMANGADANHVSYFGHDSIDTASFDIPFHSEARLERGRSVIRAMIDGGAEFELGYPVRAFDLERLQSVLEVSPERVDERGNIGWWRGNHSGTPLHQAAHIKSPEAAGLLIQHGADLRLRDSRGETALDVAVNCDNFCDESDKPRQLELIRVLLDAGSRPTLHAAALAGDADLTVLLLRDEGVPLNAPRRDGATPLDIAIQRGHTHVARLLREAGGRHNVHPVRHADLPATTRELLQRSATADDYARIRHTAAYDVRDRLTLSAWIYRMRPDDAEIVGKWRGQLRHHSFALRLQGGFRLRFEDGSQAILDGYVVPMFEWVHYAATYDGRRMRVYLNGEQVAEKQTRGRIASSLNPLTIGTGTAAVIEDVQV